MTQKIRNDTHVGWFHVVNRGARKYDVFIDDDDRSAFVEMLARQASRCGVDVVALCLMANHYHLILGCPQGNMSSMMQALGSCYTRQFNASHGFSGPLFERRFESEHLDTDEYCLIATRYVHRNPLEVGLDIDAYPWSSYGAYVGQRAAPKALPLSPDLPLMLAGGRSKYREFVEQDLASDNAGFADGVRVLPPSQRRRFSPSLDQIDNALLAVEVAALPVSRGASLRRQLAILIAVDSGAFSIREIASHHGYASSNGVRNALRRARLRSECDLHAIKILSHARQVLSAHDLS